jgi:hypothetical protein
MRERVVLGMCALACLPALAGASPAAVTTAGADAAASAVRPTTDAEREKFLLEAEVVKRKGAPGGVTGSYRAILRLGDYQHDAHIQPFDEYKAQMKLASGVELDFRDSWRNNVAAYRIDRLLGLGMVPATVERRDPKSNKMAAFTWWVDDLLMDETERFDKKILPKDSVSWNRQLFIVRIFDQLIYNFDRNMGNLLIDKSWNIWMIDHTRAFKVFKELRNEKNLPETCEAGLLAHLRELDKARLEAAMKDVLDDSQIDALLARRDRIVAVYDSKIAERGEAQVLFTLPPRIQTAAAR